MFEVAGVAPSVQQSGIVFDTLVGPWIEQVGRDRYRLSPLLRDSGEVGLTEMFRNGIHTAVVEGLMSRRPFPADQLNQVFLLAFSLKHVPALAWFAGVLVHKAGHDKEMFNRLAEELSVFAMANRGETQLLFPEDAEVSAMLRYAQFRVSIATADGKQAVRSLNRTLFEINKLTGESKLNFLALTLSTALMELSVPLAPRRWYAMLKTLAELPNVRQLLTQRPLRTGRSNGLPQSPAGDDVLFINRATRLNGIDDLCGLIDVLDSEPDSVRDRYLLAASSLLRSVHHIVSSAWPSETNANDCDGKLAASKLARLRETASRWKYTDMAVELACAEAAMLDEYADDKIGALSVLKAAQSTYPSGLSHQPAAPEGLLS